jgi:hypothetical protein
MHCLGIFVHQLPLQQRFLNLAQGAFGQLCLKQDASGQLEACNVLLQVQQH